MVLEFSERQGRIANYIVVIPVESVSELSRPVHLVQI